MQISDASQAAHVFLRYGRLLFVNGADTAHVHKAVSNLAQRYGYDARLLITSESLLITIQNGEGVITKLGPAISGASVNMGALNCLNAVAGSSASRKISLMEINNRFNEIETQPAFYPGWVVVLGMGLTTAALARLFGAPWIVVAASILVGISTQMSRHFLVRTKINPFFAACLSACIGGLTGALLIRFFPGVSPTICLVAAGMILVPGVPLVNGLRDALSGYPSVAIGRLMTSWLNVFAIAIGLYIASQSTGASLPVEGALVILPALQDFLFSGLAGIGFACLFNVPVRKIWVIVICAMAGHGVRTLAMQFGLNIVISSGIGAFTATMFAFLFAANLKMPTVIFAFPGIVAMTPGSFAFRTVLGAVEIMKLGPKASLVLMSETFSLAVTTLLVITAIAIGLTTAIIAAEWWQSSTVQSQRRFLTRSDEF